MAGVSGTLVVCRHCESEWNKLNLFTGLGDPDLTAHGEEQAGSIAELFNKLGLDFDKAYTSNLRRARRTAEIILSRLVGSSAVLVCNEALNERDYGVLTSVNSDEAVKRWGEEQVRLWRRSYDSTPPNGESLKETMERVVGYFKDNILKEILSSNRVLMVGHGNSLRALMLHLERLVVDQVKSVEIKTGACILYRFGVSGDVMVRDELT